MKKPVPILRGEYYYLRRRVPSRYASVDTRGFVQHCLFTDSFEIAQRKATEMWAQMIEAWEAKLDGQNAESGGAKVGHGSGGIMLTRAE
ncbi:hypothetical protein SAMN04487972_1453 [Paracoccus halophilus]|uniref:DUF6538 domain-containing protein n=1 Tax=Paracoccus halophilus TaxID=376733 RepID=A0A099EVM9_9RHOB|nr:DUF6538 domain-containing protein [Paracoccus halophilus]KGJ02051.1 hypothetical protein IT41_18685 [Paracoccus halophilus]SFA62152.1 hypothetical protein SAMN04487972_1453 [Paracoccus halophilus]